MKSITVTLGDQSYMVNELPTRKNAEWRRDMAVRLRPVAQVLEQLPNMNLPTSTADLAGGQVSLISLTEALRPVGNLLLNGMDDMIALIMAYSPQIAADRERIENEAYDSEILGAFTAILGLAYPFGSIVTSLERLGQNGQAGPAI